MNMIAILIIVIIYGLDFKKIFYLTSMNKVNKVKIISHLKQVNSLKKPNKCLEEIDSIDCL